MNRQEFEALGVQQKEVEAKFKHHLIDGLYTVVRLDGRAFHTFTRGLDKPFDDGLLACMESTTKALIREFHASLGYTQSDEITIVFGNTKLLPFGGVYAKILSTMASYASTHFIKQVQEHLPSKAEYTPTFDARLIQFATVDKVLENLVWRETDATRNSLSMLAQSVFSSKKLHGKGRREVHDMLHREGINWNDLPSNKKRGAYFAPKLIEKFLTDEELARIPDKHKPKGRVIRRVIDRLDLAPMEGILHEKSSDYEQLVSII